ncbi:MAG: hypothetical protein J1F11_01780 [Oscillospiraceae bacterium]|nr:hypothetical protein [Oscillospiraceae bacterium]
MKLRNIFAGIAAAAVAVSAMAVSASALTDNQKAYGFGGYQVTWDRDIDGDDVADLIGGSNGSQWLGSLKSDGTGTITVPVAKGDKVEVVCESWDSVTDAIFVATIDGTDYDCYFNQPVAYTVNDDISELNIDIKWIITDGVTDGYFNDYCGNYVLVTSGGGAAAPAGDGDSGATTSAKTGNAAVASIAAVMAVAGVAAAASRKRK